MGFVSLGSFDFLSYEKYFCGDNEYTAQRKNKSKRKLRPKQTFLVDKVPEPNTKYWVLCMCDDRELFGFTVLFISPSPVVTAIVC